MIIRWKVFESSDECAKWQEENPKVAISTMQPICKGSQFNGWEGIVSDNEKNSKIDTDNHWVVFVTYFERSTVSGPQTM